jgi:peptidoglycan/LPS O-acetylase OafA/YrhL
MLTGSLGFLLALVLVLSGICLMLGLKRVAFKLFLAALLMAVFAQWIETGFGSAVAEFRGSGAIGTLALFVLIGLVLWGYLRYRSRLIRHLRSRPSKERLSLKQRLERD